MKVFTKCLAMFWLLTVSLGVYASRYNSLALAEQLINQTNMSAFATDVTISSLLSLMSVSDDEKESLTEAMKEVYGDDFKKELADVLVKNYSDDELRMIMDLFKNPSINKCFKTYYENFTYDEATFKESKHRFDENLNLLRDYANGKMQHSPKYLKHNHFGKKYKDDNVLKMLKLMDGLKGNSIVAYDKWAQDKKAEDLSMLSDSYPELKKHPKELDKFYDATKDTFTNYWRLKENPNMTERDFLITVTQLETNETFRRFFIEVYSISTSMHEFILKRYKLKKKLENMAAKKHSPSAKSNLPKV